MNTSTYQTYGKLRIFCIAGGSGVGKTTMRNLLLEKYSGKLHFSVSATTRNKGEQEEDGKDYFFLSPESFAELEKAGGFIETNPFVTGNRYGTLLSEFKKAVSQDKVLLVDCEMNGVEAIFKQYPGCTVATFLDCNNEAEVISRLTSAGTRKREKLNERILGLNEQRALAERSKSLKLFLDTAGLSIPIIFDAVSRLFIGEYSERLGF